MASIRKKHRKGKNRREKIGPDVPNITHLGPNNLPNLSIVCPFCDEDSRVQRVYASYKNLLEDEDMDRIIITPYKIYYPRKCTMGHTFWSVEEVPEYRYEQTLEEIAQLKEYTKQEMAEYRDSLEEARVGYQLTRGAKDKLKRDKARAEKEKQKKEEQKERARLARIKRAEERERIRQAKLDGTWVPPERKEYPVLNVVKHPGKKGYTVIRPKTEKQKEAWKKVVADSKAKRDEAKRIKARDEFLNTPGILSENYKAEKKERERIKKRDEFLNTPGILR